TLPARAVKYAASLRTQCIRRRAEMLPTKVLPKGGRGGQNGLFFSARTVDRTQIRPHPSRRRPRRVARETFTKLIDDLDGGEAHETVKFGLDGHFYEIDLSTKNANKLRNALAGYVESGTRVTGRTVSVIGRGAGRGRGTAVAERDQNKAIRS